MNPSSSSGASEDSDVACYVLAYLLHENYSQTADAFLKECRVLPTGTLLVLPQTSLKTVVSEHKSRHESNVLLQTLGGSSTHRALWTKLNKTLQQMKCLYDQLLPYQPTSAQHRTVGGRLRSKVTNKVKQAPQPTATATMATSTQYKANIATPNNPQATPTDMHEVVLTSITSPQKTQTPPTISSPHRRKPVPKRKAQLSDVGAVDLAGTSYVTPPSPTMHQILETFLEDNYLPGKLADIINKCVDSDSSKSELSTTTLDSILNLTQSEPAFEGLLQGGNPPSLSSTDGPPPQTSDGNTEAAESSASQGSSDEAHQLAPPPKRARLDAGVERDFPSDKDIDDFLDQLHH